MLKLHPSLFFALFGGSPFCQRPHTSFTPSLDLAIMRSLINCFQCRRILEIGVGTGANAALFLRDCPAIESYIGLDVPPGTIPPLDYQAGEVPKSAGIEASRDLRFRCVVTNNGAGDFTPSDLGSFDFAYIDGDHSYEGVKRDTELARAVVRRGIIAWHDYGRDPPIDGPTKVIDAINESEGNRICGVDGTGLVFEIRQQP